MRDIASPPLKQSHNSALRMGVHRLPLPQLPTEGLAQQFVVVKPALNVSVLLVSSAGQQRSVPAFEFLRAQPAAVREQLVAIVDAVRTVGPDQWMDPNTHRAMKGEIDPLTRLATSTAIFSIACS